MKHDMFLTYFHAFLSLSDIKILNPLLSDLKMFGETNLKLFGIINFALLMIFQVKINEIRVNEIQLKFGKNSDKQDFFLDGDNVKCEDTNSAMTTAFVSIQNEQIVTSICNGDKDEHVNHNREIRKNFSKVLTVSRLLSLEYRLSKQEWGDVYYKKYDRFEFQEAREKCEIDGTSLPVPRSGLLSFFLYHE